ncbi:MAG: YfhO family protein [Anaerolineae bacterium]|nr:YfhO family protein [Anaerolineae bacterium]
MSHPNRLIRFATRPAPVAVIVLTALWALFFWRLWTPVDGDRVIFDKGDFPLHYFSYADYQVERMWDGDIPLWNPYNYGGDPFAANVQWVVWYPPRWIAAVVAGPGGWDIEAMQIEVAVHYWLISLMMVGFLRVLVKRPFPALVGSIVWTYGGYLAGYPMLQPSILYAIAWLPLLMLGVHLSITDPRWRVRGILLGGVMIALSFFGGHTQTTMQITYFAGAYLVFTGWRTGLSWRGIGWRIGLLGTVGAALAAIQLLPAAELVRYASRSENYHYLDKATGFTPAEFVSILWPRVFSPLWWPLYAGVAGLLLGLGAIWRGVQYGERRFVFWIGALVVCLLLALGGNGIVYDAAYLVLPGVSFFREQERAASLAVFALVVLAAYQIDWLASPPNPLSIRNGEGESPATKSSQGVSSFSPLSSLAGEGRPKVGGRGGEVFTRLALGHLTITGLAFLAATVIEMLRDPAERRADDVNVLGFVALISLLFYGWLVWQRRETHPQLTRIGVPAALVALIVLDLFSFGTNSRNFIEDIPANRTPEPAFLDVLSVPPENVQWRVDGAAGIQTYGTFWRIPDIYGTGPFALASMDKLRQIPVDRFWEVLAVRYATLLTDTPELPAGVPLTEIGTGTNISGQSYTLYELDDPRPLAHLVYDVRVAPDNAEFARQIMADSRVDLREMAVTTEPLPFELSGARPANTNVSPVYRPRPEWIELRVSTPENALLTMAIANYPGWVAKVDGKPVDIIDTYAGLIGIPIQPGNDQRVALEFRPTSILVGGAISILALIGLAGYGVWELWRWRRQQ